MNLNPYVNRFCDLNFQLSVENKKYVPRGNIPKNFTSEGKFPTILQEVPFT